MAPWLLCCLARSPPATAWRTLQQMTLPIAYANCCYASVGYLNIGGNLQFATKTRENTSISRGTMVDGLLAGRCLLNVRMKMNAPTNCLAKSMRNPIPRHWVSVTPCPQDGRIRKPPWPHQLLCCFARSPPATAWRTFQQMTLLRA